MSVEAPPKRRGGSVGIWVFVVAGLTIMVLGFVFASRFGASPSLEASPLIGEPVPSLELERLDGEGTVALDDSRGDVMVVNFWASWCTGCRVEHDALLAAAETYQDFDVSFIGIMHQDQPGRGIAFLDELGRGQGYEYLDDSESRAGLAFGVLGLPETFFINREGTIVGKLSGPATFEILNRTIEALIVGDDIDDHVETGEVENLS